MVKARRPHLFEHTLHLPSEPIERLLWRIWISAAGRRVVFSALNADLRRSEAQSGGVLWGVGARTHVAPRNDGVPRPDIVGGWYSCKPMRPRILRGCANQRGAIGLTTSLTLSWRRRPLQRHCSSTAFNSIGRERWTSRYSADSWRARRSRSRIVSPWRRKFLL